MKTDAQNRTPGPFPLHTIKNEDHFVIVTNHGSHYAKTFDPSAARLIASAPELLSALELFIERADEMIGLSDFGNPSESDFPLVQAREAIRKAKGE